MAQENVETVRRLFELWTEGKLDSWMEPFDPDVVVHAPEGWPEGTVTYGVDAWLQQAERLRDTWAHASAEVEDIRPVGDDRVIARIRYVTHGKDPGMAFDTPMSVAVLFADGKITRMRYFWDHQAAVDAVEAGV